MFDKLSFDLWRLAVGWWKVDRVRISPTDGQLLRLRPPCVVMIDARPAEIVARVAGQSAAGPYVLYDCHTAGGPCQLRVVPLGNRPAAEVVWIEQGVERPLSAESVEVYQGTTTL